MKKLTFVLMCLCLVLFGCPHNVDIADGEKTLQDKQYDTISALAYIGGSVVYNPENLSSAQLYNGANIAIHLGRVSPTQIIAKVYKNTLQDESLTWGWKESVPVDSVELVDDYNVYGYLKIQSVSPSSICFVYHKFSDDGKETTSTHTIRNGNSLDLNGDSHADLKYTPLLPIRTGFDGAMCLQFISDQEAGYTTMYATITDEDLSRNARSFTGYENSTFYGVNSNGSFIYIKEESDTTFNSRAAIEEFSTVGLSHGDYIINSADGEIYAVVGDVPEDDIDINENKFQVTDDNNSDSTDDLFLKEDGDYTLEEEGTELEEFFTYLYRENQFADKEKGPQALLQQLPKEVLINTELNLETCSTQDALLELSQILLTITTTDKIVAAKVKEGEPGLSEEDKSYIQFILLEYVEAVFNKDIYNVIKGEIESNGITDTATIDTLMAKYWTTDYFDIKEPDLLQAYSDLIALNRSCIERYYPESPRAIVDIPEVSNVYPLMSLNISEIPTELNDVAHIKTAQVNSSRGLIPYDELDEKYIEYLEKKNRIDTEFDKFYSFSLSSIKISDIDDSKPKSEIKNEDKKEPQKGGSKDKDDGTEIEVGACHFDIRLGITGSFNSRWGHLDSGLASALYISMNANLKEIEQEMTLIKKSLGESSKTFMIGPIPITFGFETEVGVGLEGAIKTPINFAIEFTGMYGAGVNCTVDYGKKRSWNPFAFYFTPQFKGYLIQHTAGYAGFVTKDTTIENSVGGYVVFKPYLELAPKVALGPQIAYAGIELPLQLYFKAGFGINNKMDDDTWFWLGNLEYSTNYYKWGKIATGASIDIRPVIGVKIPIINKKIETKWDATNLFHAEVYLSQNGTFKATTGGFILEKLEN